MGSLVGSIEPGKAADLILLRTDGLHMAPLNDPVAAVVLHAGPARRRHRAGRRRAS